MEGELALMLFLFDIDGTLLRRLPPVHRQAICSACASVYGVTLTDDDLGNTAGMTDTAILRRALGKHGVGDASVWAGMATFYQLAADAYDELLLDDLSGYHTPYAIEALDWLESRGAALALVTGNIERIAWRKLQAARLAERFRCGAFGDEAESRDALPPLALQRAHSLFGRSFAPREVFVIGDTPHDIACGVASGLRTIGVATGPHHSAEQLRACGPDFVIEDLRSLEHLTL